MSRGNNYKLDTLFEAINGWFLVSNYSSKLSVNAAKIYFEAKYPQGEFRVFISDAEDGNIELWAHRKPIDYKKIATDYLEAYNMNVEQRAIDNGTPGYTGITPKQKFDIVAGGDSW